MQLESQTPISCLLQMFLFFLSTPPVPPFPPSFGAHNILNRNRAPIPKYCLKWTTPSAWSLDGQSSTEWQPHPDRRPCLRPCPPASSTLPCAGTCTVRCRAAWWATAGTEWPRLSPKLQSSRDCTPFSACPRRFGAEDEFPTRSADVSPAPDRKSPQSMWLQKKLDRYHQLTFHTWPTSYTYFLGTWHSAADSAGTAISADKYRQTPPATHSPQIRPTSTRSCQCTCTGCC